MTDTLFFEDFRVGDSLAYGGITVTAEDIVAYASVFDAQDMHIDPAKAAQSFVGGLIASGWHTGGLMMRMMARGFLINAAGMGAPGLEELKWLKPVKPGDSLSVRHEVLEVKESRSRPEIGLVRFRFDVLNQSGERVQQATNWVILGRKGLAEPPAYRDTGMTPPRYVMPPGTPEPVLAGTMGQSARFDALEVGEATPLGSFTFMADDIIAFARAFDPQRFHIDEAAAKASLFGGLCASGWHTAAVWMRLMVAQRRHVERTLGAEAPRLGPSPGFRNLKWLKPVFAGDTITYSSTITDKRPSASRPGWGLVFHQNTGANQHGEPVFSFDGCVFWER